MHLTLVRDAARLPWGPVAAPERVPSLLDEHGRLFTQDRRAELLARATLRDVGREFRAQLAVAAAAGRPPTHLDFHCLADGGRADILDLTLAPAAEHGTAVRVWLDPARAYLRARGLPVTDNAFLDSFALPPNGTADRYAGLLRALPPGLNEWAVHPGGDDARARAQEPDGWRVRATDRAFLMSPMARRLLAEEGVTVLDYGAVRRVWAKSDTLR